MLAAPSSLSLYLSIYFYLLFPHPTPSLRLLLSLNQDCSRERKTNTIKDGKRCTHERYRRHYHNAGITLRKCCSLRHNLREIWMQNPILFCRHLCNLILVRKWVSYVVFYWLLYFPTPTLVILKRAVKKGIKKVCNSCAVLRRYTWTGNKQGEREGEKQAGSRKRREREREGWVQGERRERGSLRETDGQSISQSINLSVT